jgi:type II pantothenate kinase
MTLLAGLDFGLTNFDAVLVRDGRIERSVMLAGRPATPAAVHSALDALDVDPGDLDLIATTGGRHRDLPGTIASLPVHPAGEAAAVGLGGLALAGLEEALVVSAGSGTAMIAARGPASFEHVTGTAVGGGTLLGLARLLIGTADPNEIARLATLGDPGGVDSTLADAIGGGVGNLPATATAVNFGRVASLEGAPSREDTAAGLMTLVPQVIAVIALNAASANGLPRIVIVGHLPDLAPVRQTIERVWEYYGVTPGPIIPTDGGRATALGAALAASIGR